MIRQAMAGQDRHEQELAEFRPQQEERDQRFHVLLEEIRFLHQLQRMV